MLLLPDSSIKSQACMRFSQFSHSSLLHSSSPQTSHAYSSGGHSSTIDFFSQARYLSALEVYPENFKKTRKWIELSLQLKYQIRWRRDSSQGRLKAINPNFGLLILLFFRVLGKQQFGSRTQRDCGSPRPSESLV